MADALDDDILLAAVAAHSEAALEAVRSVHTRPAHALSAVRRGEPV